MNGMRWLRLKLQERKLSRRLVQTQRRLALAKERKNLLEGQERTYTLADEAVFAAKADTLHRQRKLIRAELKHL